MHGHPQYHSIIDVEVPYEGSMHGPRPLWGALSMLALGAVAVVAYAQVTSEHTSLWAPAQTVATRPPTYTTSVHPSSGRQPVRAVRGPQEPVPVRDQVFHGLPTQAMVTQQRIHEVLANSGPTAVLLSLAALAAAALTRTWSWGTGHKPQGPLKPLKGAYPYERQWSLAAVSGGMDLHDADFPSAAEQGLEVIAFYKFVVLDDYVELQPKLQAFCEEQEIRGTILLAKEGINSTVSGSKESVEALLAFLRSDPRLKDLEAKYSSTNEKPFRRLKVRVKKEIVTMGVSGIDSTDTGYYVKPKDWNKLLQDPDAIVIDCRNKYEHRIGTFEGAVDPGTDSFREFPEYVKTLDEYKKKKVVMSCTGGIRCVKAAAYMRQQGFEEVYQLEGGILKYLEEVPEEESMWKGQCFVFDRRVAVGHGLVQGDYDMCFACGEPMDDGDKESELYEPGVSCPRCHDKFDETAKDRFRERMYQMRLAQKRSQEANKGVGTEVAFSSKLWRNHPDLQPENNPKPKPNPALSGNPLLRSVAPYITGEPLALDLQDTKALDRLYTAADGLTKDHPSLEALQALETALLAHQKDLPQLIHVAVKMAISKALISTGPAVSLSVVTALPRDHSRLRSKEEDTGGEDVLSQKARELQWLLQDSPGSSWELLYVDDGGRTAGQVADEIIASQEIPSSRVLYLHECLEGDYLYQDLKSVEEPCAGEAMAYGLWTAIQAPPTPGKQQLVLTAPPDLSATLAQSGRLVNRLITDRRAVACTGSRFEDQSAYGTVKGSTGPTEDLELLGLNDWFTRMLLPGVGKETRDLQSPFKAFKADALRHTVPLVADRRSDFDLELLMLLGCFLGPQSLTVEPIAYTEPTHTGPPLETAADIYFRRTARMSGLCSTFDGRQRMPATHLDSIDFVKRLTRLSFANLAKNLPKASGAPAFGVDLDLKDLKQWAWEVVQQ